MINLKRLLSTVLLVVGTALLTYATTRTWTTELVLKRAQSTVRTYLESKDLIYVPSPSGEVDDAAWQEKEEVYLEGRKLLADINMAGGMYHWWNEAIPFWGIGLLLFVTGCLLPFVRTRSRGRSGPVTVM